MGKKRKRSSKSSSQINLAGLAVVLLIVAAAGLLSFRDIIFKVMPSITGMAVEEKVESYTEAVNLTAGQSEYNWSMEKGKLKSFSLSGIAIGNGSFKVYLRSGGKRYLVLDDSALDEKGISEVTGLAVAENNVPTAPDRKDEEENKTINAKLEYKSGSLYDADDDGAESIENAIDYSVENTEFSWDADKRNLCTRWQVYSIENESATTLCYGAERCCSFVDLAPASDEWDNVFYAYYGRYGEGLSNNVSAQVLYVDYSLDVENIYSEIYFSNWSILKAEFAEKELVKRLFTNVCVETCNLDLKDKEYAIEVEAENVVLLIDGISYSVGVIEKADNSGEEVLQQNAEINRPVKWVKKLHSKNETEIPSSAENVVVRKVTGAGKEDITKSKAKTRAVMGVEPSANATIEISDIADEYELEYETEAPVATEEELDKFNKRITISSNTHYESILSYTAITDSPKEAVRLYWINDGVREDVTNNPAFSVTFSDINGNGMIDELRWITPSLSSQTFEVSIAVLNVYTHVRDYENWTVAFNTTGSADLIINSTNAQWTEVLADDANTFDEMQLLGIRCGENDLSSSLQVIDENENYYNYSQLTLQDSIKPKKWVITGYNCSGTGYITNYMIKAGYAALMFSFGEQTAFAYDANVGVNFTVPTDGNNSFVSRNWTYINLSITNTSKIDTFIINLNGTNVTVDDDSLVLLLHFNNNSAIGENNSLAVDESRFGNNGALYNFSFNSTSGPGVAGKFGKGVAFDGINDYVDAGSANSLEGTSQITVMAWIKSPETTKNTQMIAAKSDGSVNAQWEFRFSGTTGAINFASRIGGVYDSTAGSTVLQNNTWHHVAVTFDGSNVKIYLNRLLDGSAARSGGMNSQGDESVLIGARQTTAPALHFSGTIDEVRIYNRTLSSAEINASYNAEFGRYYMNQTDQPSGSYTYYAWVNDTSGNSDVTKTRTVNLGNIQPNLTSNIPTQNMQKNDTNLLNLSLYFSDPDGDTLTFTNTSVPNMTITYSGSMANLTPDTNFVGLVYVVFTASDGKGGTNTSNNVSLRVWDLVIRKSQSLAPGKYTYGDVFVTNSSTWTFNGDNITGIGVNVTANNMTIESGAVINATEGGFTGGTTGNGPGGTGPSGSGAGGAGHGGKGGNEGGSAYGAVIAPLTLGSGGGGFGAAVGGNGGGAIFLNITDTLIVNGTIRANGGNGTASAGGGGSGGSIYIVTNTFGGNSTINAIGGNGGGTGSGGAGGRIAVYYTTSTFTGNIQASGGSVINNGGAGTIYIKASSQTGGDLIIDNAGTAGAVTNISSNLTLDSFNITRGAFARLDSGYSLNTTNLNVSANLTINSNAKISSTNLVIQGSGIIINSGNLSWENVKFYAGSIQNNGQINAPSWTMGNTTLYHNGTLNISSVTIDNGGVIEIQNSGLNLTTLTIESGGNLTHKANSASHVYSANVTAANLTIKSGGSIIVDRQGYTGGTTGNGPGGTDTSGSGAGGAGHGGTGGSGGSAGGSAYGAVIAPLTLGSGGGGFGAAVGGNGGGAIFLNITDTLIVNGTIRANGGNGTASAGGGGSGGSIYIVTNTFGGNSTINAIGGNGGGTGSGGAGGRIAAYYTTSTFSGIINVSGGKGNNNGGVGTSFNTSSINITTALSPSSISSNTNITISGEANILGNKDYNVTNATIGIYFNGVQLYYNNTMGALVNYSTPNGTTTNNTGEYGYKYFVDVGGNHNITINISYSSVSGQDSRLLTFDSTAPVVNSLNNYANNSLVSSRNTTFGFNATETNPDTCVLYHNASGWAANVSTAYTSNVNTNFSSIAFGSDGSYLWNVYCNDTSGNAAFNANNLTIRIDAGMPIVKLNSPANNSASAAGSVAFRFTSSDVNLDTCKLYLNNSANGPWNVNATILSPSSGVQNLTTIDLSDGAYLWNVWCNDSAGNSVFNASNYTAKVDGTSPTINWVNSTGFSVNITSTNSIIFYVNATEENAGNCTIYTNASGGWSANVSNSYASNTMSAFAAQTFPDGVIKYSVWCNDSVGNLRQNGKNFSLIVDTAGPAVKLDSPTNNSASASGSVSFRFTPSDANLDTCKLYLNNSVNGPWNVNATILSPSSGVQNSTSITLSEEAYLWNVWCNDTVGNVAFNATNYTAKVDGTAPVINWVNSTGYLANITNTNSIIFYVNATEENAANCTIYTNASGGWSANVTNSYASNTMSAFAAQTFPDGVIKYSVWCNDSVGNLRQHGKNFSLIVDTVNPVIKLNSPSNNSLSATNVNFAYTATDINLNACELWLDNGAGANWKINATNASITSGVQDTVARTLQDGAYLWNFKCNDSAGNSVFNLTNYTVRVDTAGPVVNSLNPNGIGNNNWSGSLAVTFGFNATEANADKCVLYHNYSGTYAANASTGYTTNAFTNFTAVVFASDKSSIKWNVYCNDTVGNAAWHTGTGNFTINIDSIYPKISFGPSTEANNTNFSRSWIYVNVSVTEINERNVTFSLYNTTALVNETTYTDAPRNTNWTNLNVNERYYYNATISDSAGNSNITETRILTLDNLPPTYSNIGTSGTNRTNTTVIFNATWYDISSLNGWKFEHNQSGSFVNVSNMTWVNANVSVYSLNMTQPRGRSLSFRFWANDSLGNLNSTPLQALVVVNTLPAFNHDLASWSISSVSSLTYDINCSDADGDSITYLDDTLLFNIDGTTGIITDSPSEADTGAYTITITCNDGDSVQDSFTYTISDATPPTYTGLENNASNNTRTNEQANFSATLADGYALASFIFSWNNSGSFVNDSPVSISGTSRFVNVTKTVTASQGASVCGKIYFNDSYGNRNVTENSCFNVAITDTGFPTYANLTNNASSVTRTNGAVRWSIAMQDTVGLSSYIFSWNNSGSWANDSSVSISGNYTLVNVTKNVTSALGSNVCGRFYISDGASNMNATENSCFTLSSVNSAPSVPSVTYPANNSYIALVNISLNITSSDADGDVLTYYHFINNTLNSTTSGNSTFNASEGSYKYNVYASDNFSNSGNATVYFVLDVTFPRISFGPATEANNTNFSRSWIYVNVSVNETNEANITFSLYNTTALADETSSSAGIRAINWTGLASGTYYYNATISDSAGNRNNTETRTISIDTNPPLITNVSAVSVTSSSALIKWITNELSNSTVEYGLNASYGTNITDSSRLLNHSITVSGLNSSTTYHYRVYSSDIVGNMNGSRDYGFTTGNVQTANVNLTVNQIATVNISNATTVIEFIANGTTNDAALNVTSGNRTTANNSINENTNAASVKYLDIKAGENLTSSISSLMLKIFYTDDELAFYNVSENSTGIYWYNTSLNLWQKLNSTNMNWVYSSGTNMSNNFAWANISHLSAFGLGGLLADGAACTANAQCDSSHCSSDYDGAGAWCAASASCAHDGTIYADAGTICYGGNVETCTSGSWGVTACSNGCSNGACSSSSSSSASASGGGGGGGAAAPEVTKKDIEEIRTKIANITKDEMKIDTGEIIRQLYPGEITKIKVNVENRFNVTKKITSKITGSAGDFLTIQNQFIELEAGEETDLMMQITIPKDAVAGTYSGEIELEMDGNVFKTIPVEIKILEEKERLLDLKIEPVTDRVSPGETLRMQVNIYNLGLSKRVDMQLNLQLIDIATEEVLNEKEESLAVETTVSLIRTLKIPDDTKPGKYLIRGTSHYTSQNKSMEASSVAYINVVKPFEIQRALNYKLLGRIPVWMIAIGAIVLSLSGLSLKLLSARAKRRRRYQVQVDYNSLPRHGRRSAFAGNVAETNVKTYFDLDKLQTHTLIAGATGCGKTVSAQGIVEEALLKNVAIVVFDPTAQWTGFLRKNDDKGMLSMYRKYGLRGGDARAFNGNIHQINDARKAIEIKKYMQPGEINIFTINKLSPKDTDMFVANTVREIFYANMQESKELKLLIVYDEVHRLLPKFGGSGEGFIQIERACREFRKWGIGLVLISQVLSDFVGAIKANIGTEIQMRSRDEGDLERVREKYGSRAMKSLIKSEIGTGLVENADYNKGRAYFVSFRPLLHSPRRLPDNELDLYDKYNELIEDMQYQIEQLEKLKVDAFDLNLELKLAMDKLKIGNFNIVEIYTGTLKERLKKQWEKLKRKPKKKSERLVSKWEIKKEVEKAKKARKVYVKTTQAKHKLFDRKLLKKRLKEKQAYIVEEKQSETSFELFKKLIGSGYKGLCITRINPEIIMKKHKMKAEVVWLTTEEVKGVFSPTDLPGIMNKIDSFTKENKKSVVLLDGLLFIKNSTAFENMLNLIEHIKDKVATREAIFIAPVNTDVLPKEQKEQLENEFARIDGWRKGE